MSATDKRPVCPHCNTVQPYGAIRCTSLGCGKALIAPVILHARVRKGTKGDVTPEGGGHIKQRHN